MKAHILTVGDEILIGQTVNTNASYIGAQLSDCNIVINRTSVVGDTESDLLEELHYATQKSDVIIITGGLGPTHDDITRDTLVKFFGTRLIKNDTVLNDIYTRFKRLNRPVTKTNEDQANVPEIATVIRNTRGTAPGYWIEKDDKIYVAMPGVPSEMKEMMTSFVIPRLKEKTGENTYFIKKRTLLTTGIAESVLFDKFGDINDFLQGAKLAFLPSEFGVKLRITVTDKSEEAAENKLTEIEQKIRGIAGRYIYGKEDEDLAEIVGRLLKERNLTIAVAESCTGGNICHRITNISGSSEYFERGIIAYSNAAKVEILKVDEDVIQKYGAVSYEVARQMAEGVRAISGSDIGIAATGIMGPLGGSSEKPIGTVYLGYCDENLCTAVKITVGDDRILNKQRTTQAALALVRRALLGIPLET